MHSRLATLVASLMAASIAASQSVQIENAFPSLSFSRPVDFQHQGDSIYVVEQDGVIRVFKNDQSASSATTYMDISSKVSRNGNEEGLLGLAFAPDYGTSGYLYVYYSASSPRRSVIERYTRSSSNSLVADGSTATLVMTIAQPYSNHNGGQLAFGSDGYLYIGLGDGGSSGDPQNHGQDRGTLLGNLLRIDVSSLPYSIPTDNPLANNTNSYKEEIWAWGFRNPWRFSFDMTTGELYAADVGQNAHEEIDVVAKGGNYGWKTMEGPACYSPSTGCDQTGLTLPVHSYATNGASRSITGGYVYRSTSVPSLNSKYIYADYVEGTIWALTTDATRVNTELMDTPYNIASFGQDAHGEVYILAFNGNIYRFSPADLSLDDTVPDQTFTAGSAISALTLPGATGGIVPYTFAISPDVPAGLMLDASTRTVSGTPTSAQSATAYTWKVTDHKGSSVSTNFTITIEGDASPSIALRVSPSTVSEGAGVTTVSVTATVSGGTYAVAQSIPISVTGSGTTSAVDFVPVTDFTFTVATGADSGTGTFTLTPIDDTEDETDETITISSTHADVSGSTTLTLTDDDSAPGITLTVSPATVSEDAGATTVTVTATKTGSASFATDQSIVISVSGSGADGVVDFAAVSDFTIALGASAASADGTFTLTPTDDSIDESDETITISSTHPAVSGSITLTLTDDDAAASIVLIVSPTTVSEGAGTTTVTVTAAKADNTPFVSDQAVPIAVTGSGAADAVDFGAVSDFTITVAAGTTSENGTFSLAPVDDAVDEADEIITISSTHPDVNGLATLTLTDDDSPPTGIALFLNPTTVAEDAGPTIVTVLGQVLGGTTYAADQTLTITVAGSGQAGVVDFYPVADLVLTVEASADYGITTFTLEPIDDTEEENDETISIASPSPLVADAVSLLLTDDDSSDPTGIALAVSPTTVGEGDGATAVTVSATVLGGGATYTTDQVLPITVEGSGQPDVVEFVPVVGFDLVVPAGATTDSSTFDLEPVDDTVLRSDEVVTVSTTNPVADNASTITIVDNDEAPHGISLAASPMTIGENDGLTTVTVTANVQGGGAYNVPQVLTIDVDGSGITPAVDFADVSEFDLVVPIGTFTGTASFSVNPENDRVDELNEVIRISSAAPAVVDTAYVTLEDDDAAPIGVRLSVHPATVDEGQGPTPITATMSVSGQTTYATDLGLVVMATGSGNTSTVDFVPVSDFTVTVAAEAIEGSKEFTLIPVNDEEGESDEIVTVSSTSQLVLNSATVLLTDDDGGPTSTEPNNRPVQLTLEPPYPNPTRGAITFKVAISEFAGVISLRIFNMLGQPVAQPLETALQPGEYRVRLDNHDWAAGVYVYVLESQSGRQSGRFAVTR